MKKILFFLFAICVYGPSFANVCEGKPVIDNNQLLCQDKTQNNKVYYISCDQKNNNHWMVGCDGKIYECKNNQWTIVTSRIRSCAKGWENNAASDRNKPANTISNPTDDGFIYFFNPNQDSFKNSICQYTKTQCDKDIAECTKRGDHPISCTICGPVGSVTNAATNLQNNPTVKMYTDTETLDEVTVTTSPIAPTQSEQVAPTGTEEYECTKSGGDKYENGKCICDADKHLKEYKPENAPEYSICKCVAGYKRDSNGECVDAGDYETHEEFDSAAWRRDTENAYKHERDNAQSLANKGITAGSTLLTGEGAMKAAQALAEQKADRDAEIEMAEWISKMGCEYGNGQQVNLGKEETLPGGNELTQYYTEYKQLADKLKATKAALNLRPGIEAEVLYDRAETGLYQYANPERQSGGFTSLSRALMNPDGTDAEQWNAQKAEVAKDLTTGTLLTAGGLATGAIGNYFVNRNHKKEYQELEEKFREIKTKLEHEYPEIFIPTEIEPVVVEVVENPEKPNTPIVTTRLEVSTRNETFNSDTFPSGHITLSEKVIKL